tara:strand:- start:927 stop:1082 length:156 start_codon:yes stop_codon:yes gene_type:complete
MNPLGVDPKKFSFWVNLIIAKGTVQSSFDILTVCNLACVITFEWNWNAGVG